MMTKMYYYHYYYINYVMFKILLVTVNIFIAFTTCLLN